MTRPVGPLPVIATDATYTAPGKPWDGQPTKVAFTTTEKEQGFQPKQRVPAEKLGWKLNQIDRWLKYLDGIEAKNWDAGAVVTEPTGSSDLGVGTEKDLVIPLIGTPFGNGITKDTSGGIGSGFGWIGDGTGGGLIVYLDLPDETVITGIDVYINPAAGGAIPTGTDLPSLAFQKRLLSQSATADIIFQIFDPTTPNSAYRLLHSFGVSGFYERINTDLRTHCLYLSDENGANAHPNLTIDNVKLTIRDTPLFNLYETPGALANSWQRKAVCWNPITKAFYAITSLDSVTTPLVSYGKAWEVLATGLSAPTQSTVDLTFVLANAGDLLEGSKYYDATNHVWTLDADHLGLSAGTRGPYAATIYSPGGTAYYGPIEGEAGTITGILEPKVVPSGGGPLLTSVNNSSDATPGVDSLCGYGGSIAADRYGGMVVALRSYVNQFLGQTCDTVYRLPVTDPTSWAAQTSDFDPTLHGTFSVSWSDTVTNTTNFDGAFLLPAFEFSGSRPALFWIPDLGSGIPNGPVQETLPNKNTYTAITGFAAAGTRVCYVSHNGSTNAFWTADSLGGVYTEHGDIAEIDGRVTGLEWSDADLLFILTTNTGHVYTSTDGFTWTEPSALGADSCEHVAVVGGSWLVAATTDGAQSLYWTGDQGVTWTGFAAPWPQDGTLMSLVALDGGFGGFHVTADGTARLYRSLAVF